MTTDKQLISNQQNALLSTGAKTEEGKAIVARNAVKHGIFTNDLIIHQGDGRENPEEYNELLNNLIVDLKPVGQLQHILVENIAIATWRLRRLVRFETGCIRQSLDNAIHDYYNSDDYMNRPKTTETLDKDIAEANIEKQCNLNIIQLLKKGVIKFDKPTWKNENTELDIIDLLYNFLKPQVHELLTDHERELFHDYELTFKQIQEILKREECSTKDITTNLIHRLEQNNLYIDSTIKNLLRLKQNNQYAEDVHKKIHSLPSMENSERIMRYEKALQNTIFKNLTALKQLQNL